MMIISLDLGFFSFVSTATSITSGSVAERIKGKIFKIYIFGKNVIFLKKFFLFFGVEFFLI